MNSKWFGSTVLLALLLSSACSVYNDSCPVTAPEVWGKGLAVDLDIREEYVRQCEAPVGNFLADALRFYPYGLKDEGEDVVISVGLINAGAIRDQVVCGEAGSTRDRIPKGPITDQDIYQLLPFNQDAVVVVKMTGQQLERVLERSVSSLTLPGDQGIEGHFLQVSGQRGIRVTVDCNGTAQTLTDGGKAIGVTGERIISLCLGPECSPILETGVYYVATLDFMVGTDDQDVPNDGFVGFHQGDPDPPRVFRTHLPVIDVVRDWLVNYEEGLEQEFGAATAAAMLAAGYPAVADRLVFQNCGLDSVCGLESN